MKTIIGLVIATIAVFVFALGLRLGVHKPVVIAEQEEGPFKVVYKNHTGAYYKIVPAIEEVEKWAKDNSIPCELTFGEYLDDPKKIDEDRLQSNGGCIVDRDLSTTPLPQGFQYREIPRRAYVSATFDGAPSIGPYKVYPKIFKYLQEHNQQIAGPVLEVYHVTGATAVETKYLFPPGPLSR